MKRLIVFILVLLLLTTGAYFVWFRPNNDQTPPLSNSQSDEPSTSNESQEPMFSTPKKSAHFETSTPAHGSTLAAAPPEVVLDFNFDLASNSTIQIMKDGKDYGTGSVTIDTSKLAMRRAMAVDAPNGVYTVNYKACWPDRSCHDGHFQFSINRNLISSYSDQRGVREASISMSQIKFEPVNVRINVGQTMTWVNNDNVDHYVNTDSHPAHSHTPGLNSRALAPGATYSYTFTKPGAYPYHCSAHAGTMTGMIVVE